MSLYVGQAFEQYGEIEEGAVITDKGSGKSRGFGFITFRHMDSAQRALKEPSKNIDVSFSLWSSLVTESKARKHVSEMNLKLELCGVLTRRCLLWMW